MYFVQLFKLSQADRHKFCSFIIESSAPSADYYFLVILSTLIVAMGLLADNIILVIGGMLVTPLLSPILAFALGIVINERKVIFRSVRIFFTSFIFAFVIALIAGFISTANINELELISIMKPSLFTMMVAIVAGLAASYTWAKPNLNETLPGIAVTVTLIPPLTAVGLAVSHGEWAVFRDVVSVLLLNIFGIITASLIVFSFMDFYKARRKLIEEVKEEEKEIKKEKKKLEKAKK